MASEQNGIDHTWLDSGAIESVTGVTEASQCIGGTVTRTYEWKSGCTAARCGKHPTTPKTRSSQR